eukprot:XP_003730148.1 PREDICTED: lysyl oxidase homolog 3 [Strongylocentrotus purpuratus]
MTAMKFKLVLCFLLGLFSISSAQRQHEVRFMEKGSSHYPYAGRVDVYIDGAWGTICASDWDMNDAEVVCREIGLGYPYGITVVGGPPAGAGAKCLSRVKCYGHEDLLSECEVYPVTRTSSTNDKGIVCYPPPSDAGLQLKYGPDQYSGYVEVKLASGSWSPLYIYYDGWDLSLYQYISNICRQLGFGELNFWDSFEYSSTYNDIGAFVDESIPEAGKQTHIGTDF